MDKLLVIGAGSGQVHVVKVAKKLGYYVITVSIEGDYPGFKLADEVAFIDIFDVDKIVEFARKANVKGVVSDQSDMAAPIVAQVAEQLGLPNWGYETALKFTDKIRMRAVYEELGFPVPKYFLATTLEDALDGVRRIGYPIVIKPTDAYASRGVFKIFSDDELMDLFPQSLEASRSGNIIVEQFLSGDQFFSQGFVENHKLRLYAFSDRYYYNLPDVAIPYTNAFPAKISPEFQQRMTDMFTQVVEYLNPAFGHVWAEWIYDKESDMLFFVEMAIRGGGAYVTDTLIPNAYGIDSQEFLVRAAMNNKEKSFFDEKIIQKSCAFYSFLLPEGFISKIEGIDKLEAVEGVLKVDIKNIKVGDYVPPIVNKGSRYGMIIIKGDTRDDVDKTLAKVKKTLNIEVTTSGGTKSIIWE